MGFIRIIIIIAVILLIISVVRRFLQTDKSLSPKNMLSNKQMVKCSYCDVFIPEDEAIRDVDNYYCNKEHQSLARRD